MIKHEPKFKAGDILSGVILKDRAEVLFVGEEVYLYKNSIGEGSMKIPDMDKFYVRTPKELLVTRENLFEAWMDYYPDEIPLETAEKELARFNAFCKRLGL